MRKVITAHDVPGGGDFRIPAGSLVTPSAREAAAERGVRILELPEDQIPPGTRRACSHSCIDLKLNPNCRANSD